MNRDLVINVLLIIAGVVLAIALFGAGVLWRSKTPVKSTSLVWSSEASGESRFVVANISAGNGHNGALLGLHRCYQKLENAKNTKPALHKYPFATISVGVTAKFNKQTR